VAKLRYTSLRQNKFIKFEEISLSDLYVGESNVRAENVTEELDVLTEHIHVNGLLESIVVFAIDDLKEGHPMFESRKGNAGKFEILAGQRRFAAFKKLNEQYPDERFDKIPCHVRTPPEDELDAKAISIGENLTQLPMTLADSIDACDALFKKYGNEKDVSKKYGISVYLVRKYVKFARLPKLLQGNLTNIHKTPKTALNIALDANDALDYDSNDPDSVQKVYDLAKRLGEKRKKSTEDYKKMKMAAEENPKLPIEEIEKKANKVRNPKAYKITLDPKISDDLEQLAENMGHTPEEEGAAIIEDHLDKQQSSNN